MQNLLEELKTALEKDERLVIDGRLVKNKIVELALSIDETLLGYILESELLCEHFFRTVHDVQVFDKIAFQKFVSNKQFLPDSYTEFKNKIGLTADHQFLTESKEVQLVWPYKDCVLEGGQTKEEQTRHEIFWNETLAHDEIDRLLSPKVLTNFKRITKNGEDSNVVFEPDQNLLIRGNNLLALHSLKERYEGAVKLIYIDPPYNTGNDSFGYNDSFNHSAWLTFMTNRLKVAKELLTADGSIFISIDENEIGYVQVLMDEIFGRENRSNVITVKRGSVTGHKAINPGVVNISEYVIAYCKNYNRWRPNRLFKARSRSERYNNFIRNRSKPINQWEFCSLLEAFAASEGIKKTQVKKRLGAEFEPKLFEFIVNNKDAVIRSAEPDKSKVSKEVQKLMSESEKNPDKIYYLERSDELDIYLLKGQRLLFYTDRLKKLDGELVTAEPLSDIWDDVLPNDLHNEGGVTLRKGKKSEKLIGRIIELATEPGDTVLDYHLGSGTTAAVAMKLGRVFVGVEQLDYGDNDSVVRLKNTINGEQSGISKTVDWKGGGEFVYCELAKCNAKYVDKIEAATNSNELISIWGELESTDFISYKIDTSSINESSAEFQKLEVEDQKRLLIDVLDKNQLYINYSEIEDADYSISNQETQLNRQFYEG